MNKKSFNDIELIIRNAAEANEPAFDEQAWNKMEALLDKEKDRKRPFVFWLWWLLPLLIGAGVISYFSFNKNDKNEVRAAPLNYNPAKENVNSNIVDVHKNSGQPVELNGTYNKDKISNTGNDKNVNTRVSVKTNKPKGSVINKNEQSTNEKLFAKKNLSDKVKGKMNAKIVSAKPAADDENSEDPMGSIDQEALKKLEDGSTKQEEVIVIKVDADKVDEKQIEKMIDSVINESGNDKKSKNKLYRFYIIAAAGAEGSGVKLFSTDKITARYGLAVGYQVNKNLSVQAGFFASNKKYKAAGGDYKTKPGTYWNIVDIKNIEANCRVYEIPVTIRYDFMPGKNLNIFASAGLSSYIMKKEDYHFYYDRYGTQHQADVYYNGNKNLFSVLRLSAGIEKKVSGRFSIFASPGIAIPISGVGEGEVKLYSTDIIIGLKFSAFRKK